MSRPLDQADLRRISSALEETPWDLTPLELMTDGGHLAGNVRFPTLREAAETIAMSSRKGPIEEWIVWLEIVTGRRSANPRKKKPEDDLRKMVRPTILGGIELDPRTLTPVRQALPPRVKGQDYGADPIGEDPATGKFMFRMVPSGAIVDTAERTRRLEKKTNPRKAAPRDFTCRLCRGTFLRTGRKASYFRVGKDDLC